MPAKNRADDVPHSIQWVGWSAALMTRGCLLAVLGLLATPAHAMVDANSMDSRRQLVVDHITPHNGDPALIWDQDNWQTLCKRCHDGRKRSHDMRGRTADEWFAMLRDIASERGQETVKAFAQWIPERIRVVLGLEHSVGGV